MDNTYDRIVELCNEKGIKPGKMCAEMGLSRGMISDLKMGRTKELSIGNTTKIADYFRVSVDYLLGNVSEPFFYLDNERILREINSYGDESKQKESPVNDDDIKFALFGDKTIDDETYESVKNFAKFAAEQKRNKKEGE